MRELILNAMKPVIYFLLFNCLIVYSQDRNIQINEVYPPAVFKENGGKFINVKNLVEAGVYHTNAKGDGVTDDSDAIIAAMDWVMNRLRDHYAKPGGVQVHWKEFWNIYFPDGTYLVSKPLVYSGERVADPIYPDVASREGTQKLILVGQSRENTIIKLLDNAPLFQWGMGQYRPLISFSKFDKGTVFNNMPAHFQIRNFTINTGTGNPRAIGLDYYGANLSRLDNIKLSGSGHIGLHIRMGSSHGYHSNIIVEGFNYGVYLEGDAESHPVFEYLTLKNQLISGIYMKVISASFRKVHSTNSVNGITLEKTTTKAPHMAIIDSEFTGGSESATAINLINSFLFARGITIAGYGKTVVKNGATIIASGPITEYVSESFTSYNVERFREGEINSMNMPVLDYPIIPWVSEMEEWANVNSYGAVGDGITNDQDAIQEAFNSGKKVIYFPDHEYNISGTVTVPASVEQIIGSTVSINGGGIKFNINEKSDNILLMRLIDLQGGTIRHSEGREMLLESTSSAANVYESTLQEPGTKLFVNNTHGFARLPGVINNINVWNRYNNNEKTSNWQFNTGKGSNVWMMGFKSEKTYSVFNAEEGSCLEVVGGLLNRWGTHVLPSVTGIRNNNSHVSLVMASNGPNRNWVPMIEDIQNGDVKTWEMTHFPNRGWDNNIVIPLYVSYNPDSIPTLGDFLNHVKNDLHPKDNNSINYSIYPNPSKDKIKITNASEISDISIINLMGREFIHLKGQGQDSYEIDMQCLIPGVYIVKIRNNSFLEYNTPLIIQ